MGSWGHAIGFGLFWGAWMFPVAAGKRPEDSLRKALLSTLLVGLVVGLIDSFGWRAWSVPMVFVTVPSALAGFYLSWSTKLRALMKPKENRHAGNTVPKA
jgi:hypothetical protein